MTDSGFYFGAPQWAVPAAVFAAVAIAALVWSYASWRRGGWPRVVAALAKSLALAALAVCLLEPLYSSVRPRPGANLFLVAIDNSQSLGIRDRGSRESRAEQLRPRLDREATWQTRLSQDFDVRRYAFDARLRAVDDFASVNFDGAASTLGASLSSLSGRYRQRPVAGVLLFTDGNATDWATGRAPKGLGSLSQLPPVYPVVLGNDSPAVDLEVRRLTVSQTDFEAAPVTIVAEVAALGQAGKKLIVELLDESGATVERQSAVAPSDGRTLAVRFQTRPEKPGLAFYSVRVQAEGDDDAQASREATLANNRRLAVVDRDAGPYRVLYVAGRPNWDFKFLRRALEEDPEMELAALVRIAKREPKFEFLGKAGESTNPLFSGFNDKQDEEAQRYDQPVLLRVGMREGQELRTGFPKSADVLFDYHAIILDDIEAEFFSQDQLSLIRRFVSLRGGGLLMLGGPSSFQDGGYRRTPLDDMLPIYMEPQGKLTAAGDDPTWRMELTREGWLQPWVRVRSTEEAERNRLRSMPSFQTVHRVGDAKPGAMPLATLIQQDGPSDVGRPDAGFRESAHSPPALAAQRYGDGRTAAIMIGDMWRWGLKRESSEGSDLETAWRQTVRWLVADAPRRVEFDIEKNDGQPAAPLRLVVRARDEEFRPLDNAAVLISVTTPGKESIELTASASETEPGVYETSFAPKQEGAYRALASVRGPDGAEVGSREAGFAAEPAAEEFQRLTPNRRLLERVAKESGGEVLALDRLDTFVAGLSSRKAPVTEHWSEPLWHRPWVLIFAVCCLAIEWGLRRWRGMP